MSNRNKHCRLRLERLETRTTPSLTPIGPEVRVNQPTQNTQWNPDVAADASGSLVVAFAGYDPTGPGSHWGVYIRRYAAGGIPIGDQQLVAETGSFFSNEVSIAGLPNGGFVVVWSNIGEVTSPDLFTVNARVYSSEAAPVAPAIRVSTTTSMDALAPQVSSNSLGQFAVTWTEIGAGSQSKTIRFRRFTAEGQPIDDALMVASEMNCQEPQVALCNDGTAVVAYENRVPSNLAIRVHFKRITADGQIPAVAQVMPAQGSVANHDLLVDILALPTGAVLVGVASSFGPYCSYKLLDPLGQLHSFLGVPGGDFKASVDNAGNIVVAFKSWINGVSMISAFRLNMDASTIDPPVLVNQYSTPFSVDSPIIAIDADGDGFIAWNNRSLGSGTGADGSSSGVFGRGFAIAAPRVMSSPINNGSPTRSDVKDIRLDFNRNLILPTNPTSAAILMGPNGALPVAIDTSASTPAGAKLKFTFPGGLAAGRYTLRLLASQVTDTAGQPLDGNGDGITGDDYVMQFHKLPGDFDGDGHVDAQDFGAFRGAFGTANLEFDLNDDGFVDAQDFFAFRSWFGQSV